MIRRRREARLAGERAEQAERVITEAADIAISRARRTLMDRMPTLPLQDRLGDRERVDVAHVLEITRARFGMDVTAAEAASALRSRLELRMGEMDLLTDAYDGTETGAPSRAHA